VKTLPGRLVAAFRFLTIFPLPGGLGHESSELGASVPLFPLVGLTLGVIAAAWAWLFWSFLPPPVAAVLLTTVFLAFSGGLHLDGLADTADGFFSARSRERILEIMRDSRIGAMGVLALVLLLLLKVSSLAVLGRSEALRAALLIPLTGRCAIPVMMALLPYARSEGGLGTVFYNRRSRQAGVAAFVFLGLVFWLCLGVDFFLPLFSFVLVIAGLAFLCHKIIRGATGDTLGAACELSEVGVALALALLAWNR